MTKGLEIVDLFYPGQREAFQLGVLLGESDISPE